MNPTPTLVKKPKKKSPTARSLEKLRKEGWTCAITERWNPFAKLRQDLFGFVDLLCFRGNDVLAVQTTSGDNVSHRLEKIHGIQSASLWLESPNRKLVIHGWRLAGERGQVKRWFCRELFVEPFQVVPLVSVVQPELLTPYSE